MSAQSDQRSLFHWRWNTREDAFSFRRIPTQLLAKPGRAMEPEARNPSGRARSAVEHHPTSEAVRGSAKSRFPAQSGFSAGDLDCPWPPQPSAGRTSLRGRLVVCGRVSVHLAVDVLRYSPLCRLPQRNPNTQFRGAHTALAHDGSQSLSGRLVATVRGRLTRRRVKPRQM